MKTIQMTIDEDLLGRVDRVSRKLRTTRSAFARDALRAALDRLSAIEMERRHREGYRRNPARPGEFDDWGGEQVWPTS
jgi:metal-responsive CopG/Arc/MetJ family transcriptional regulator